MVKTIEQAKAIQSRRAKSGKRGYAKAVRRYLKRNHADDFLAIKNNLAVAWPQTQAA